MTGCSLDTCARRALPWLVALAAVLRLSGLAWDDLTGLHPDEGNLVRAAAALAWPDKLIPDFHAYNGLAVWLPRLAAWPVCGAEPTMTCLTGAARVVSALFASAAVLVGALWARDLAGPVAAAIAALLLGASAPLIQWAHFGTTESVLILVALLLARIATLAIDGRLNADRAALASALVLGLGLGMKTTVLVFAVIPLTALAVLRPGLAATARTVSAGAVLTAALWVVTTPAILWTWADWQAVMQFEGGVVRGTLDVFWTWQFFDRTPVLFEARQLWGALEGAGLVLALVGLLAVLGDRALLRRMAPVLVFLILYSAIIFTWYAKFFRYLAPVIPFLLILAALGAQAAAARFRSETIRVLILCGPAIVTANGLTLFASHHATDPRISAANDLTGRLLPGDRIVIEPRDIATGLPGGGRVDVLPLDWPLDSAALADRLAGARFMLILSRRNWSVLPRDEARFPGACAYYAQLASGRLGFRLMSRHTRWSPLGRLAYPGMAMEETRVVFDAPEVFLLERIEPLDPAEIARRLAEPMAPEDCHPDALQARWRGLL